MMGAISSMYFEANCDREEQVEKKEMKVITYAVEESLVAVQQSHQVGVLVNVFVPAPQVGKDALLLLLLGEHDWGEEAVEPHDLPLLQGERHALWGRGKNWSNGTVRLGKGRVILTIAKDCPLYKCKCTESILSDRLCNTRLCSTTFGNGCV